MNTARVRHLISARATHAKKCMDSNDCNTFLVKNIHIHKMAYAICLLQFSSFKLEGALSWHLSSTRSNTQMSFVLIMLSNSC